MIIFYILLCILLLGVLIAVHEFGHFIVALKCGCIVHEFAIGMGPLLWSKEINGIKYSLRLLPIGGFCDIEGEAQVTPKEGDARMLCNMPAWKQLAVFLAGVTMNFILGFILMFIGYSLKGLATEFDIAQVFANTCNLYSLSVTTVFDALGKLFTGTLTPDEIGGVIGAVNQISSAATTTIHAIPLIFVLMGSISVNLAIINLFPLPALDGGRCMMIIINKVKMWLTKKPLSENFQEKSIQITMVMVLALTMLITIKDVFDLF